MLQRIATLTPPLISAEHIEEKITCIRAHRERLFLISTEIIHDKLIVHDYGQGGAGWTFLFGCVNESIKQFEQKVAENRAFCDKTIGVIGAGCYGLLTAIILAHKGYSVRIMAKESANLPSLKAAGFFFPRPRKSSTTEEIAVFENTGIESYKTYQTIIQGTHPFIKTGAQLLPAYYGLDIDPGFGPYIQKNLIAAPEKITIDFGNGKYYDAYEYQALFINAAIIMQELQHEISKLGIIITQTEIDSFEEIQESIIFNCAGLGAKKLTGDKRIVPVQGHLISLKNQHNLDQLQYMLNFKAIMPNKQGTARDELIYYAPKKSGILGITFIRGQDSLTANQHEFERLLQRCKNFFGTDCIE